MCCSGKFTILVRCVVFNGQPDNKNSAKNLFSNKNKWYHSTIQVLTKEWHMPNYINDGVYDDLSPLYYAHKKLTWRDNNFKQFNHWGNGINCESNIFERSIQRVLSDNLDRNKINVLWVLHLQTGRQCERLLQCGHVVTTQNLYITKFLYRNPLCKQDGASINDRSRDFIFCGV